MILVIAARDDTPGLALVAALRARGCAVRHLTPNRLVWSRALSQRLSDSECSVEVVLADGSRLCSAGLSGVVNRMVGMPEEHLAPASPDDRAYARSEWHAAMLGLLATLPCPLLNPPAPSSLCGVWHGPMVAAQFAAAAGLAGVPETRDSAAGDAPLQPSPLVHGHGERHVAFDGRLYGPLLPPPERDALLHVAHLWGTRLLELQTVRKAAGRHLAGATPLADPAVGGTALLSALVRALT